MDVFGVPCGARFVNSDCKKDTSIDALVSDQFDDYPDLISRAAPRGVQKLTASDVIECVVRNPLSIGSLSPGVAARGEEECSRDEDHGELHFGRNDVFGECEIECGGDYTELMYSSRERLSFI